jgi:hypothetical protein
VSGKVVLLDRVLAIYGPGSKEARDQLRNTVSSTIERTWPKHPTQSGRLVPRETGGEFLYKTIEELSPTNDFQRSLKAQAISRRTQQHAT